MIETGTVILIDDDSDVLHSCAQSLELAGLRVETSERADAVVKRLGPDTNGIVVTDIRMPGLDGIALLRAVQTADRDLPVIRMTGHGDVPLAVEAMRAGAYDFLEKPFDPAQLVLTVTHALEKRRLVQELRALQRPAGTASDPAAAIIGASTRIEALRRLIRSIGPRRVDVLITGETGAGKELVARTLHQTSDRASGPFVAINCGALPETLIESELFGHEKGSFTGATGQRLGKFELCDGGTIFLDEIGDMALATQTKILRVLQQGEIQRVGGTDTIRVDVRIIAATNKNLEEMVPAKAFREDLYYRLNVVRIKMPPLRERPEDIPQIVDFCLQNLVKQRKTRVRKVAPDALAILRAYRWPGNVRELENVIYRSAVIAQGDTVLTKDLPVEIQAATGGLIAAAATEPGGESGGVASGTVGGMVNPFAAGESGATSTGAVRVAPATGREVAGYTVAEALDYLHAALVKENEPLLARIEREMVTRVIATEGGNQARAAEILGLPRATLRKRLDEFGIKVG